MGRWFLPETPRGVARNQKGDKKDETYGNKKQDQKLGAFL